MVDARPKARLTRRADDLPLELQLAAASDAFAMEAREAKPVVQIDARE